MQPFPATGLPTTIAEPGRQFALWRWVRRPIAMDWGTPNDGPQIRVATNSSVMATRFKPDKRRNRGRLYLLTGFAVIILMFAWHNSAYLSANWSAARSAPRASRQRQSLEKSRPVFLDGSAQEREQQQQWDVGDSGGEETDEQQQQQQQQALDSGGSGEAGGSSTSAQAGSGGALKPTQGDANQQKQQQHRPKAKDAFSPAPIQHPVPRASAQRPTLVLYVYFGTDFEHEERLGFFIRAGIRKADGAAYRIILAHPSLNKASLPPLPDNARYMQPSLADRGKACNSTWGAIASVLPRLDPALDSYDYIVVVDSLVIGPLVPPYVTAVMHWTEAFTSRLSGDTKMVGSYISCEGTPKGGDVGAEWRLNPYVLPHAWATDKEGWATLAKDLAILQCHDNSSTPYWDARYYGDSGASLAMLNAGYNLGSLLLRYQGVDWRNKSNWECNARVRPDVPGLLDGMMPSPYEVVFLPLSLAEAEHRLVLRTAARYSEWIAPASGRVELFRNEYWTQDYIPGVCPMGDWKVKGERVLTLQQRWACFDEEFYRKENPDLAELDRKLGRESVPPWEHFLVLGQFQGRAHKFMCGEPQLSNEDRIKLALQRGRACFDHVEYKESWPDLSGYTTPKELWIHYVDHGQFEGRQARFVCPVGMSHLVRGFDGTPVAALEEESRKLVKALWSKDTLTS